MLRLLLALAIACFSVACVVGQRLSESCRERYRKEAEVKPKSTLVHYQLAECLLETKDRASAVNEFREALNGDLQPPWTKVWSYINVGMIFDATGQRERALLEYEFAARTKDNTRGAQDVVARYQKSQYKEP